MENLGKSERKTWENLAKQEKIDQKSMIRMEKDWEHHEKIKT